MVLSVICFICVTTKQSLKAKKRKGSVGISYLDLKMASQDDDGNILSDAEARVYTLALFTQFLLLCLFEARRINFISVYWFIAILAFTHVPKSLFFPVAFFVSQEDRWGFFKKFIYDLYRNDS